MTEVKATTTQQSEDMALIDASNIKNIMSADLFDKIYLKGMLDGLKMGQNLSTLRTAEVTNA